METLGRAARVRFAHEALLSDRLRAWGTEVPGVAALQIENHMEAEAVRWSATPPGARSSLQLGLGIHLGEVLDLLGRHRDENGG